jgi:hypothetical protein
MGHINCDIKGRLLEVIVGQVRTRCYDSINNICIPSFDCVYQGQ